MQLNDRNAVQLAELLLDYFTDCVKIDPTTPKPSGLTVQELLDDLSGSVSEFRFLQKLEDISEEIEELFVR
jgi:hypothetical protein